MVACFGENLSSTTNSFNICKYTYTHTYMEVGIPGRDFSVLDYMDDVYGLKDISNNSNLK